MDFYDEDLGASSQDLIYRLVGCFDGRYHLVSVNFRRVEENFVILRRKITVYVYVHDFKRSHDWGFPCEIA